MWRVVVCDQENLENEEAKARYRAVENTTTMGCNARKTNKQTTYIISVKKIQSWFLVSLFFVIARVK